MLKILSGTIIIVSTIVFIIVVIGIRSGKEVNAELIVKLPYDRSYVYEIFTDIENYPQNKRGIKTLEILEKDDRQIMKWRENYENGSWREYELIG